MVDFKPSTILHEGRPHVTGMTSVVPSRHEGDQFLAPQAVAQSGQERPGGFGGGISVLFKIFEEAEKSRSG